MSATTSPRRARWPRWLLAALVLVSVLVLLLVALVAWLNVRGEGSLDTAPAAATIRTTCPAFSTACACHS